MDCTSNHSATIKQDGNRNADEIEQQINQGIQQQVEQSEITAVMVVNKGKRTKRQRLHNSDSSPVLSSMNDRHEKDDLVEEEDDDEEQLDMAKCLILLAQGQSKPSSSYSSPPVSVRRHRFGQLSGSKRRRRSYSSSSLTLGLAAGVYECQTCNRSFPSFQALGGHRASHKKLKITTTAITNSHHDYFIHPLSLQLGNINYSRAEAPPNPNPNPNPIPATSAVVNAQSTSINNKKSNKIHECSICGAEFSSGQALGGHMRRHRGHVVPLNPSTSATTTNTIAANTTLSLNTTAIIDINSATAGKLVDRINNNNDSFLSLDLNQPASSSPELDTKFSLDPKRQSAAIAFSSTLALVDCFHGYITPKRSN